MYIVKHVYSRIGNTMKTKIVKFETHKDAMDYVTELRGHETVLLLKKDQRQQERRTKK